MSLYINTETGEYPRHIGDVELNPDLPWATVEPTTPPELSPLQILKELPPELVDGIYYQRWDILTFTQAEWDEKEANRIAVLSQRRRGLESEIIQIPPAPVTEGE